MKTKKIKAEKLSSNDVLIIDGEERYISHVNSSSKKIHVYFFDGSKKDIFLNKTVTIKVR